MGELLTTRVAREIHDRQLIPPHAAVLALVSGGADSTTLLHLLHELHPGRLGVLTIDHGLRGESAGETAQVRAAAERLGCDVWCEQLQLTAGAGLQERARDGRRAAAERVRTREGFDLIATGHTASDQAETVLFRLARGSGRDGLCGIAPREGRWVRPLLTVTRAETAEWCRTNGHAVVDDPSNADPRFARSRVRHGLVPHLQAIHPAAERNIVRASDLLRDEGEVLREVVEAARFRCARDGGLDVLALSREPMAVQRLLVRALISRAECAPDARWVDQACALVRDGGAPRQLPGGLMAVDTGLLVIEQSTEQLAAPTVPLAVPGTVEFGGQTITARRGPAVVPTGSCVALTLDGPLIVRSPRDGDRIRLAGGGHARVGALLAQAGVPARHRERVPIVVQGDRVVWVAGYRADPVLLAPSATAATLLEMT